MAVADLDGDGDADVVTANRASDDVSVLLGDGSGGLAPATTFSTVPPSAPDAGRRPMWVAVGHLDGDGDLDVVTANEASDDVSVLLAAPVATLAPAGHDFGRQPVDAGPSAPFAFALTNPGTADLAVDDIRLAGPDAGAFTLDAAGCPATLAPATECAIAVRFDPAAPGAATAILRAQTSDGTLTATLAGGAAVPPPPRPRPRPIIGDLSDQDVSAHGGQWITIHGANFSDCARVVFGDVPAAHVRLERFYRITAIVPRQEPGVVAVRVITPAGMSPITKTSALTVHPG